MSNEPNPATKAWLEDYATERLLMTIKQMRDACDDAEREVKDDRRSDLARAARVLHIFQWAWANASTNVESAMAHAERMIEMERAERKAATGKAS